MVDRVWPIRADCGTVTAMTGSSVGLVSTNAQGVHFSGIHLILKLWRYADFP